MQNSKNIVYIVVGLIIFIIIICGLISLGNYNSIQSTSLEVENKWGQVQVQYQRRFDLVPNLVESVKGTMTQEKEIFTKLADARAKYSGATTVDDKAKAAGEYDSALSRLLVITENYPELRSTDVVKDLMIQLEGTENRIAVERSRYNDKVTEYNKMVTTFPGVLYANIFGFKSKSLYDSQPLADIAPSVKF